MLPNMGEKIAQLEAQVIKLTSQLSKLKKKLA